MLILGREPGQGITVTHPDGTTMRVVLTELDHAGRKAKIGLVAPRDWQIVRDEAIRRTPRAGGPGGPSPTPSS